MDARWRRQREGRYGQRTVRAGAHRPRGRETAPPAPVFPLSPDLADPGSPPALQSAPTPPTPPVSPLPASRRPAHTTDTTASRRCLGSGAVQETAVPDRAYKRLGAGLASLVLGGGLLGGASTANAASTAETASSQATDDVQAAGCTSDYIGLSGAGFHYEECKAKGQALVTGTLKDRAMDGECAYVTISLSPGGDHFEYFEYKVCGNEKTEDVSTGYRKAKDAKVRLSER